MRNKYYPNLFQKGKIGNVKIKTELSVIQWEHI